MIKTHEQEVRQAVEDFLTDEFNCYDGSVGIYPIGEIDQDLVDWIDEEVEGFQVAEWDKYSLVIECEGVFVEVVLKDGRWEIAGIENEKDVFKRVEKKLLEMGFKKVEIEDGYMVAYFDWKWRSNEKIYTNGYKILEGTERVIMQQIDRLLDPERGYVVLLNPKKGV